MSESSTWQKHYDEDSNVFYYNTVDGSSQWEEPDGFVEEEYVYPDEHAYAEEYVYTEDNHYPEEHSHDDANHYNEPHHEALETSSTEANQTNHFPITEEALQGTVYDTSGLNCQHEKFTQHTTVSSDKGHTNDEHGTQEEHYSAYDERGTYNEHGSYDEHEIYNEHSGVELGTQEEHSSYDKHGTYNKHSGVELGIQEEHNSSYDEHGTYNEHGSYDEHGTYDGHGTYNEHGSYDEHGTYNEHGSYDEHGTYNEHGSYDEHGTYNEHGTQEEHTVAWPEEEAHTSSETRTTNVASDRSHERPETQPQPQGSTDTYTPASESSEHLQSAGETHHDDYHSEGEEEGRPSLVDPATLVPHYSSEDQPIIDSILEFELDEGSGDFVEELRRLYLLDEPCSSEVSAIRDGMWCTASCKKLEVFQFCLENAGSEDEWRELVEQDGGRLLRYLLLYMSSSVHPQLQDGAARCFAYSFMVCPTLWKFFGALEGEEAGFLYAIWNTAAARVQFLCDLPADGPSVGPYLGFDERDIEEFNLYGLDDYGEGETKKASPFDMLGCPDANTMVSIWCLLLFQICRSNMRQIGDAFRNRRVMNLGLEGEGEGGSEDPTDAFMASLSSLLLCSHKLKEDSYLILIKVVAAVNWQVPEKDLVGSTEIADLCAELQFQDSTVSNVNVSEGLMHLLNDIGYPEHRQPEALPCLQLCYDLIMSAGYEGFFYQNDVRILIDMVIREITNLPATKAKEEEILDKEVEQSDSDDDDGGEKMYRTRQNTIDMNTGMDIYDGLNGPEELFASEVVPLDELMKQMYLKVACALLGRSCWQEFDDLYRKTELDELLNSLLDSNEINNEVTIDYMNRFLCLQLD